MAVRVVPGGSPTNTPIMIGFPLDARTWGILDATDVPGVPLFSAPAERYGAYDGIIPATRDLGLRPPDPSVYSNRIIRDQSNWVSRAYLLQLFDPTMLNGIYGIARNLARRDDVTSNGPASFPVKSISRLASSASESSMTERATFIGSRESTTRRRCCFKPTLDLSTRSSAARAHRHWPRSCQRRRRAHGRGNGYKGDEGDVDEARHGGVSRSRP